MRRNARVGAEFFEVGYAEVDPLRPVGVAFAVKHASAVGQIHMVGLHDLLEVGGTVGTPGRFTRPAERREQHGGKNGDDGDHHEQFNQRKNLFHQYTSPIS
ncbi:hypothetical protein SDC9_197684 [bioreactor metagenome]|uniref:Uncharacterized protein n=1 Tax=bioreactor metagenome TaxID=1076179 RepID=A0A645IFH6_9ZZZZ